MFNGFKSFIDDLGRIVTTDVLMFIAIGILSAILIAEVIFAIIFEIKRKRRAQRGHFCACNFRQADKIRRRIILTFAWLFAVFALITVVGASIGASAIVGAITFADIMLPACFLLLVYILEAVFSVINICLCRCHCNKGTAANCCGGKAEETQTAGNTAEKKQIERTEQAIIPAEPVKFAEPEPISAQSEFFEQLTEQFDQQGEETFAQQTEQQAEYQFGQQIETPAVKVEPFVSTPFTPMKKSTPAKSDAEVRAEKKNEQIARLGEKIERQRQNDIKQADAIVSEKEPARNVKEIQAALASSMETEARLKELQRKMESLRQTTTVRDVQTTEKISNHLEDHKRVTVQENGEVIGRTEGHFIDNKESVSNNKSSSPFGSAPETQDRNAFSSNTWTAQKKETAFDEKTTAELRREKDILAQQYANLQNKSVNVKGRFDEGEVKAALSGLKTAMADLLKQIEGRDE